MNRAAADIPVAVVMVDDLGLPELVSHPLTDDDEIYDISPLFDWDDEEPEAVAVVVVDKEGNPVAVAVDDEPEHYGNYSGEVETNGKVNFKGTSDKSA